MSARPADSRGWSGPFVRPADVAADRTFVIDGAYGRLRVRPSIAAPATQDSARPSATDAWQLDAVRLDGRDVTDEAIEIDDREIALDVALTSQVTHVTGAVTWTRLGANDATRPVVVVFPDDPERWPAPSRWVRATLAAEDGRFSLRGLPPGDGYLAVAIEGGTFSGVTTPDTLETVRAAGTPFSLHRGAAPTLTLRAVPRPAPAPAP